MTKLKPTRDDVLVGMPPATPANGKAHLFTSDQNSSTECHSQEHLMDASEESIRELAYQKWEEAGCPSGDGFDFWLEAEQAIMAGRWSLESMDS